MAMEREFQPQFSDKLSETVSLEKALKIGETVTDIAAGLTSDESFRSESAGSSTYQRCDISELSWALERTDLSNPRQPFFDF